MTTCNVHDREPALLTPGQAAARTGLTTTWLARLADIGKLTEIRPNGTHRRYLLSEIEQLAKPVNA